jgi:hypothetical protein
MPMALLNLGPAVLPGCFGISTFIPSAAALKRHRVVPSDMSGEPFKQLYCAAAFNAGSAAS